MSASIRQSNLFAAEDYQKVFKAYQFIDYTAYDFDSLKQALLNYIQTYYPEDFNDYIESSEFIAIVELLAYFGTSLAFRTDLNSRENFIDSAERRESIIRLAQMVNYVPRRNIPASGLFKVSAVQTDQPLIDADGVSLNNLTIFWNDPNNPEWFNQFTQICNAAFSPLNPFGRPSKSGPVGNIPTDLYQLNSILRLNVTYPIVLNVNGQQYPVDVCNPDFTPNETIFERHPDPANAFNFIYRNDSLGVASPNTGFFLYFRQGTLMNIDTNFEFPVPNRLFPIEIQNINQSDVYIQETDESGNVLSKWLKVPALAGENIIYNSIKFAERNIFDVISGANDTVTVRFADGNFGNVPTGLFRTWIRTSANQALVIRPNDAQGLQINIPYVGVDQQEYTLRVIFNLEQSIGNAAPTETDEQIRLRAPEVFSTQSRMVNGSDYNVLPLIYGNQIAKIQAINRTYSGQSRYLDLNDPTGFHRDLIIFGEDGALFRDNQNVLAQVIKDSSNSGNIETIVINTVQELLRNVNVTKFFYDEYIPQFENTVRVNVNNPLDPTGPNPVGYSLLDLNNPNQAHLYWKTSPLKFKNDTGYFATSLTPSNAPAVSLINTFTNVNVPDGIYQAWGYIKAGSVLQFANENTPHILNSAPVNNVVQSGLPLSVDPLNPFASVGPIELGKEEQLNYKAMRVYPVFRNELNSVEIANIVDAIEAGISFWLYYDVLSDTWGTSTTTVPNTDNPVTLPFNYPAPIPGLITSNWGQNPASGLVYISIASDNEAGTTTYDITARGRVYVFESYRDVRFYWQPNRTVVDSATGRALEDLIEIMPLVNTNQSVDNNNPPIPLPCDAELKAKVDFNITGVYIQDDGFQDTSKIEISLVDEDRDGIPDDPTGFASIISPGDRIVFEYYNNEVAGYQSTRPWIARWNALLENTAGNYFVYFPADPLASPPYSTLFGSPYISDTEIIDVLNPESTPGATIVFMDDVDLMFINNIDQVTFNENYISTPSPIPLFQTIANQITSFFNNEGGTVFPWLANTENVLDKLAIVRNNFIRKSFLISSVSPPGYGVYYTFEVQDTENTNFTTGQVIPAIIDKYHFDKNGKSFTQNIGVDEDYRLPLYFKWKHYSPIDQRVDPSASNIIDMIVVTDSFYRDVLIWKNSSSTMATFPEVPTTEELRVQFQDLNDYKMVSDSMVWNSGTFKVLFGPQAEPELQATFKVVKAPSTNISDNEVKTRVIKAIDTYFDIRNWDFGERFFYTELAAFIHQQLSKVISSVVIVPNNASSQFGNLFEIIASPTELFLSTATVNNVQIITNLTEQNLRA